MRKREEEQCQTEEQTQVEEEEQIDLETVRPNLVDSEEQEAENNIGGTERIELPTEGLKEEDRDLEVMFIDQLENIKNSTLLQIEPREKLPKVRIDNQLKESANRVLGRFLKEVDTIPEICDKVYAMGRAIGFKLGTLVERDQADKKKGRAKGGNRRERKLKREIKESRQIVAKMSNELYRRRKRRKATNKEKTIIKELRVLIEKEATNYNLRNAREQWLDRLRYKKIKLAKCEEKRRRKQDNIMFQRDQKGFFRTLEGEKAHEGEMPGIEKFVEFWGGMWEKEERTPNMPWMEQIRRQLSEKVNRVNEFSITLEKVKKEISKRKGWTAPGIDGIQNYWWKKLESAQGALTRALTKIKEDNTNIPTWWPSGRTVLLPKTKNLEDEKNYRPITCLNTSYKIMTGLVAKYMRNHTMENKIWDEGQLGAVEGVLGTVDQLIIDRCIMDEVKQHHRNLAVAFYDYKKAYDNVHHDWMLRVYQWIGIPADVIQLISKFMDLWKTRLEVWSKGEKLTSRWINISCGFLQGDSYSPVGFCISEIPVCRLLQQSRGYRMGQPGNRDVIRTHSLFVDDLKVYQESHELLRVVNEVIVQASHDTGACYGVSRCAELVFERGKMVRAEGLEVLEERMRAMDPDKNEIYRFLGIEQADGIKTKKVFERVKGEVDRRIKMLTNTKLNDINLARAINTKVIPVAAYPMNVCKFTGGELKELDQVIKRELRSRNMLGKQTSDERLYLRREDGGRGIKSMRDIYKETRMRVACYMACSENRWISAAWKREMLKEENSIIQEAIQTMTEVGVEIEFEGDNICIDGELINQGWKLAWKKLKEKLKRGVKNQRIEHYGVKDQQSQLYRSQEKECHVWLTQNLNPGKTAAVMTMLEQMLETRAWKKVRGLIDDNSCRVCNQYPETVEHLVAGCTKLANTEYLTRHNRALMILAVEWAKQQELVGQEAVWYEQRWGRGTVLENDIAKLVWDFEFHLRKTTTSRRPDLVLELKREKKILICDMACPQQHNIGPKRTERMTKYRQLAFETRERRPSYKIYVVPVVVGALGGGIKELKVDLRKIFANTELIDKVAAMMQKTVLMDSESIIRRVISGLIQGDDID